MLVAEFFKREPYNSLIGCSQLLFELLCDLRWRGLAIAQQPDRRRRLVQTMSFVANQIVDEHLVGQLPNDQLFAPSPRMVVSAFHRMSGDVR
jgi:hypothetical protein